MSKIRVNELETLDGLNIKDVASLIDDINIAQVTTSTGEQTLAEALDSRIVSISSVGELHSMDAARFAEGQLVTALRYHSGTQPGEIHLRWSETSTEPHNGYSVFSPFGPAIDNQAGASLSERRDNYLAGAGFDDSQPGRWLAIDDLSPYSFGIIGDGLSDDSLPLELMLSMSDSAFDFDGIQVALARPVSTSGVSNFILNNVEISYSGAGDDAFLVNLTECESITLNNVSFDCGESLDVKTLSAAGCSGVVFSGRISNCFSQSGSNPVIMFFDNCTQSGVRDSFINNINSRSGVRFYQGGGCFFSGINGDDIVGRIVSGEETDGLVYRNINVDSATGQGSLSFSYAGEILYCNRVANFAIQNVNIYSLGGQGQLIKLSRGCEFGTVDSCTVHDLFDYRNAGILRIEGCRDIKVNNFNVLNARLPPASIGAGILILEHGAVNEPSGNITLTNCKVTGAIRGYQVSGSQELRVTGRVSLINCESDVTGNSLRYNMYVDDLVVKGCVMFSQSVRPFDMTGASSGLPRRFEISASTVGLTGTDNRTINLVTDSIDNADSPVVIITNNHFYTGGTRITYPEGHFRRLVICNNTANGDFPSFSGTLGYILIEQNSDYS